jgi:hypothetical protein
MQNPITKRAFSIPIIHQAEIKKDQLEALGVIESFNSA